MSLLQLVILAVIQGLTEFIPVSSSAHLILAPMAVPGWDDQGPLIDLAAHLGSLGAVMLYFRRETLQLFTGALDIPRRRDSNARRLFLFLAAATIPLVLAGGILYVTGLVDLLRQPLVLGLASIGFGLLLWYSDQTPVDRTDTSWSWRSVLTVGLAQAAALVPGTSRSGITITAARFLGFSRHEAARFSMLLSIPAILVLGGVAALELIREPAGGALASGMIVAALSFVTALVAIHLFLKMTRKMSFLPFVIYRVALGLVLVVIAGM